MQNKNLFKILMVSLFLSTTVVASEDFLCPAPKDSLWKKYGPASIVDFSKNKVKNSIAILIGFAAASAIANAFPEVASEDTLAMKVAKYAFKPLSPLIAFYINQAGALHFFKHWKILLLAGFYQGFQPHNFLEILKI